MKHSLLKKGILLMLLLLGSVSVQGQNAIVMKMKDGTKNVVCLSAPESAPSLTPDVLFDGGDIVIRGDHELRVAMSDVLSYIYLTENSGIDAVSNGSPTIVFKRNEISILHQPDGTVAMMYSLNGTLAKRVVTQGNEATISIEDLPKGVYVITVGKSSYKFLNR